MERQCLKRQKNKKQTTTKTPPSHGEGLRAGDKQHTNRNTYTPSSFGGGARGGGFWGIISTIDVARAARYGHAGVW
jgi:hypothetical protein